MKAGQRRTRVKVCGITRLVDAQVAVDCGADALGFIFFPPSPRCIAVGTAAEIVARLPPFVDRVGVFVDASVAELAGAAEIGISVLQLHGQESPGFCIELRRAVPHCRLVKAFRVGPASRAADFVPFAPLVDAFLLDTYLPGEAGGTGLVFDWSLINGLDLHRPVILAGGLSPANVAQAVQIVRPYAVDVNSGVEQQPGVKDHALLHALFAALPGNRA